MSNVQSYRSQARVRGQVVPIQNNGGGSVNWNRNWMVPDVAGNFSDQNYGQGLQTPSLDLEFSLLDGNAGICPLHYDFLRHFFDRSNDAAHDVEGFADPAFFDGSSGWNFAAAKPGTFTIGCSPGEPVRMSASYGVYCPLGDEPFTERTTPIQAYTAFAGVPISWLHCSYYTGASYSTPLEGVAGWQLTFSTGLTPDPSQRAEGQETIPVDMNAGKATGQFSVSFTAGGSGNHLDTGDSFAVRIQSGAVSVLLVAPSLLIETDRNRNNQGPRVMRPYQGRCLGIGNGANQGPIFALP
jgi:hypothetical protein